MTINRIQFWSFAGIWFAVLIAAFALELPLLLDSMIAMGVLFLLSRDSSSEPLISTRLQDLEVQIHETRGALKHVTKLCDQETARADRNWEAFCACRDKFVGKPKHPGKEL